MPCLSAFELCSRWVPLSNKQWPYLCPLDTALSSFSLMGIIFIFGRFMEKKTKSDCLH